MLKLHSDLAGTITTNNSNTRKMPIGTRGMDMDPKTPMTINTEERTSIELT
jgi:hypothetical protein